MRNIFLIIILLANTAISAQRGGGGMGRGQQQNQNGPQNSEREVKEFKASDVAGIFYYDVEEAIKKIKVKKDKFKVPVAKALKDYNFKIKEIALLNTDNFKVIDILMKSNRGMNRVSRQQTSLNNTNNQPKEIDSLRIKVREIMRSIRRDVNKNEEILNENLKNILTEKQNKKWLKYQESQKEKLTPKRQERNNNNRGQQQGQNRQRRF